MNRSYENLQQVNKTKARKLFEKGECIYIIPCKASRSYGEIVKNGELVQRGIFWSTIEKHLYSDISFDMLVNEYLYYTPKELGTYLNYYIEQ